MDLFRSLLFIPGNQPKMLEKASHFLPDVYIPDLEDSVGDNDKTDARKVVSENIRLFKESDKLIIPRVNSLESGLFEDDIAALISKGINGVSVGKIYDTEDIVQIDKIISKYEENLNMQIGTLSLIPWIETASGILESKAILKSSVRIKAAAFGAEDFTNDMGIERQSDNSEIQVAKNYLAIAARACSVIALDNPFFDFKNSSALVEDCINSKKIGYKETGSSIALPIFKSFVEDYLDNNLVIDQDDFFIPNNLILKKIDYKTGDFVNNNDSIFEFFTKEQLETIDNLNKVNDIGGIN